MGRPDTPRQQRRQSPKRGDVVFTPLKTLTSKIKTQGNMGFRVRKFLVIISSYSRKGKRFPQDE
jgi:hypothetical protein